ncbi:hypothetical protein [Sporosarcina sp. Te-1]|uniref:hypothetical protein n=1 Tax=Sporosarcina sp. Te-1 TaxID=2818390 RepID=UPI001A9D3220|nr:hypothetical protein [Sporosarcina sp. Te-1]QTD39924.1 hypothetical protein J3U78_13925 [Sporosarcina sp. Te-1]
MDIRIQAIADRAQTEFGLENYRLGRHAIFQKQDALGEPYYQLSMEWFPFTAGEIEEDENPDGTAVIDYHIQEERFETVIFVMEQSESTCRPFMNKTVEEMASFVERQTRYQFGRDFFVREFYGSGVSFHSEVDGIRLSPNFQAEVNCDEQGRLISFTTYGKAPDPHAIMQQEFHMTLEEIEPLVQEHVKLFEFPSETRGKFVSAYTVDEVFIAVDGSTCLPFFTDERMAVPVGELLEWTEPLHGSINRNPLGPSQAVDVEEAFQERTTEAFCLSAEQVEQCKLAVLTALRMEYPEESGKWRLKMLQPEQRYISAFCQAAESTASDILRPKLVFFIDKSTMNVMNLMDNRLMLQDMFNSFQPAEPAKIDKGTAFEALVPYITMEPVYVYDFRNKTYVLCGLIDTDVAVDAVSGEIVTLEDL